MRTTFIVAYDIGDPKRLRKTYSIVRGYGERLQYSVFLCEMSPMERIEIEVLLEEVIHQRHDQVVFVDLGPTDGRAMRAITAIGKAFVPMPKGAVVF